MAREISGVQIIGDIVSVTEDSWPSKGDKPGGTRVAVFVSTGSATPPVEAGLRPDLDPASKLLVQELRTMKPGDRIAMVGSVTSYRDDLTFRMTDVKAMSSKSPAATGS